MNKQIEINDLTGLSKPITKFIEVCSIGLGKITEPYLIKRRAEAKAYEIDTISKALSDNQNQIGLPNTTYEDGKIEIAMNKDNLIENDFQLIKNEILERKYYQELKKEGNINNTLNFTMKELESENEVSDEKVDEDWINRFFNTIENISNEQLQQLWAKILAGEIKQPNSYSLRTLDLLKNLSFKEAELFSKIGQLAINSNNKMYFIIADDSMLLDKFNISFDEILQLKNLVLIHSNTLDITIGLTNKVTNSHLIYAQNVIKIVRSETAPLITIPIYDFTDIGKELLSLVNIEDNQEYLNQIITRLNTSENIEIYKGKIINNKNEYYGELLVKV
jgi:uncharacterized repeat protein (TIGR03899 family)